MRVEVRGLRSIRPSETRRATVRRVRFLLPIVAATFLVGCGPTHMVVEDPALDDVNSAHLTIYRPDTFFHKYNPEEPHVQAGDTKLGTLGVGERISLRLPPGEHRISIRESILGFSAWAMETATLNVVAGEEYFVRYAYEMAALARVGDVLVPRARSSLSVVSRGEAEREIQE